jgi:F-type H+-transporting ATPase subunit gamma
MLSSVAVEKRIRSFKEIGDIVAAMKAYAAVAVRKTDEVVGNIRRCEEVVVRYDVHLSPRRGDGAKRVLVVFGSTLGLCGMFNEKMAREVSAAYRDGDALIVIGRRLQFFLGLMMGNEPVESLEAPSSLDGIGKALRESVSRIQSIYAGEGYYDLTVIFTMVSGNSADIVIEQILPLDPDRMKAASPLDEMPLVYEEAEKVFAGILEEFLYVSLYRCYVESLRSENWYRLKTMEGATETLKRRSIELRSEYNYARQEEITEEMFEILGGGMFYGSASSRELRE